ncbi:MAG: hypothetical protein ACP5UU_03540 [Thermoprotei archaeon]
MRKNSALAFVTLVVVLLGSLLVFVFYPVFKSSSPSLALLYEGTGAPYDQNWFFPNETAHFSFNASGLKGLTLSFYLMAYGGNYSEKIYSVTILSNTEIVNFSLSISSFPPRLYYLQAKAGSYETNGSVPNGKYSYEICPWLVGIIRPFSFREWTVGLPSGAVPYGLGTEVEVAFLSTAYRKSELDVELSLMRYAGIHWVRLPVVWPEIERTRGNYNFSEVLTWARALNASGLDPIYTLTWPNPLYNGGTYGTCPPNCGSPPCTAAARFAFANFAGNVTRVLYPLSPNAVYEIWNEPDIDVVGSWGGPVNVTDYSLMAAQSVMKIEEASGGRALIAAPALSEGGFSDATAAGSFLSAFMEIMAQRGVLNYLSAISVHPYQNLPEDAINNYRYIEAFYGKPVIETEWGYTNTPGMFYANLLDQARYDSRIFLVNLMSKVPITIIYYWNSGPSSSVPMDNFGIIQDTHESLKDDGGTLEGTSVYFIKPSYYALYETTYSLNGYTFSQRINATPYLPSYDSSFASSVYLLKFVNGSSVKYALWSAEGPITLNFPASMFGSSSITVTTIFGSSTTVRGHSFEVKASGTPEFIS